MKLVILAAFLVGTQSFVISQEEQPVQSRVNQCVYGTNSTVCFEDIANDSIVSLQEGGDEVAKRNVNDEQEQATVQEESSQNFARVKGCDCPRDHVCDCPLRGSE